MIRIPNLFGFAAVSADDPLGELSPPLRAPREKYSLAQCIISQMGTRKVADHGRDESRPYGDPELGAKVLGSRRVAARRLPGGDMSDPWTGEIAGPYCRGL